MREGGKEEDDFNDLLEELSQKINAQTQIVKEDMGSTRRASHTWDLGGFGFYKKNTYRNSESVVVHDAW